MEKLKELELLHDDLLNKLDNFKRETKEWDKQVRKIETSETTIMKSRKRIYLSQGYIKMWCLHCEKTSSLTPDSSIEFPNSNKCSHCGSGCMDISECLELDSFFRQSYPKLDYKDIIINHYYPQYPNNL